MVWYPPIGFTLSPWVFFHSPLRCGLVGRVNNRSKKSYMPPGRSTCSDRMEITLHAVKELASMLVAAHLDPIGYRRGLVRLRLQANRGDNHAEFALILR